jgi:hypothetical protein
VAETRYCPTCGDTDLTLTPDTPIDGWNELACKTCLRVLEIGRPGVGPLVDPLWIDRSKAVSPAHRGSAT